MCWNNENQQADDTTECKHIKQATEKIIIKHEVVQKIRFINRKMKTLEWMATLQGNYRKQTYYITDLKIMQQQVTATHVEPTIQGAQEIAQQDNIGWIHSHNNMQVFFSQDDKDTAHQSKISIVTNNKLEFKAMIKIRLPCGTTKIKEIPVITQKMPLPKTIQQELEYEINTKITEKQIQPVINEQKTYYELGYYNDPIDKTDNNKMPICSYCGCHIKQPTYLYGYPYHKACAREACTDLTNL